MPRSLGVILILAVSCGTAHTQKSPAERNNKNTKTANQSKKKQVTRVVFTSKYTPLDYFPIDKSKCKAEIDEGDDQPAREGDDIPVICPGIGPYNIYVTFSAEHIGIYVRRGEKDLLVVGKNGNWVMEHGKTLEWRMADERPFALIMRQRELEWSYSDRDGLPRRKRTGHYLIVRGLPGYEHINTFVDVRKTKNANKVARTLADQGYKNRKKVYLPVRARNSRNGTEP